MADQGREHDDGVEAHPASIHDTEDEMAACQVCQSGREASRSLSPEQERLRVEMRACLLPEYAFLADVVADLTLNPEGHVTWLAMTAPAREQA